MRRSHIFAAAMVATATLTLQGCTFVKVNRNFSFDTEKGDNVTKEFEVQSLSRLTIQSHAEVVLEMSDTPYIKASGAQNVIDRLSVDVDKDGTTWVRVNEQKRLRYKNLEIHVGTPEIKTLTFNGAVDFTNKGALIGEDIAINCNGASDLNINGIEAANLTIVSNGASDIDIKGLDTKEISIWVNGAGDITLDGKSETGKIEVNGAGDVDIENFDCPGLTASSNGIKRLKR